MAFLPYATEVETATKKVGFLLCGGSKECEDKDLKIPEKRCDGEDNETCDESDYSDYLENDYYRDIIVTDYGDLCALIRKSGDMKEVDNLPMAMAEVLKKKEKQYDLKVKTGTNTEVDDANINADRSVYKKAAYDEIS